MSKLKKALIHSVSLSKEEVFKLSAEYSDISDQIKSLDARKKELAERIKQYAEEYGVKDDKGSFFLENDEYIAGKVARKTMRINEALAVDTLESLGMGDLIDECIVRTVNEDRLSSAVAEGRLSLDVVESFTDVTTTYSVSVKEKESMPSVEQSSFKSAAKRK